MSWEDFLKSEFTGSKEDMELLLEMIKKLETFKTIDYSGNKNTALKALREYRKEIKQRLRR